VSQSGLTLLQPAPESLSMQCLRKRVLEPLEATRMHRFARKADPVSRSERLQSVPLEAPLVSDLRGALSHL
jgi:hypothetical protein